MATPLRFEVEAEHELDEAAQRCRIPMELVGLVFGPHEPIAELFRRAGRPVAPTHPIWDTG